MPPDTSAPRARLELARFYLSRDMFAEAKAVLDVAIADERPTAEDPDRAGAARGRQHHARTGVDAALKDLAQSAGRQPARRPAVARARAMRGRANGRRRARASDTSRPRSPRCRSSCSASRSRRRCAPRSRSRDFAGAADLLNDFETVGVPRELEPTVAVLTGRLARGARPHARGARRLSRARPNSADRPAAAQGRLREIALRYQLGEHEAARGRSPSWRC